MKITVEPDMEGEDAKSDVYERVFEFCVVGTRVDRLGAKSIRRLHSNPHEVFDLVGLLEAAKQELLAHRAKYEYLRHQHDTQAHPLTGGK